MSPPFGYKETTKNTLIPAGSSFQVPLSHHSAMKAPILLSMATTTLEILCQEGKVKEFDKSPSRETREAQVLTHLSDILRDDAKKSALRKLERSEVQLIVDYLDSILPDPVRVKGLLHARKLEALCKLGAYSQLYPRPYLLDEVVENPVPFRGFSNIFRGKYQGHDVCIKVARTWSTKNSSAKLAKEAIVWGQLFHPNIVPFYGISYLEVESVPRMCLVSPWMKNSNLNDYLESHRNVPRKPLLWDVACGLCYLHQRGIVHCDLKGANIVVSDAGVACITDFGESLVSINGCVISPGYTIRWMSPQAVEGLQRDSAGDVWALGCVFYEIVSRLLPFHEQKTDMAIFSGLFKGKSPTRPTVNTVSEGTSFDPIDDEQWSLMERCWALEPRDRPTCKEILAKLEAMKYNVRLRSEGSAEVDNGTELQLAIRRQAGLVSVNLECVERVLEKIDTLQYGGI